MKPQSLALVLIGLVTLSHQCNAQVLDNPFSEYLQRSVTITLGAGNAKDTNAAIHTIDPWPPYVGYTRIPGDGRRAAATVEQMYRVPDPFERQGLQAGSLGGASTGSNSGAGAGNIGSGSSTPVQSISGGN